MSEDGLGEIWIFQASLSLSVVRYDHWTNLSLLFIFLFLSSSLSLSLYFARSFGQCAILCCEKEEEEENWPAAAERNYLSTNSNRMTQAKDKNKAKDKDNA